MKLSFIRDRIHWLIFVAIVCVTLVVYGRGLSSYSLYHGDEGRWIETSKWTFNKFLVERDYSASEWRSSQLGSYGKTTPNAGKLLIGTALYLSGFREFRGLPDWDWTESSQWNITNGNPAPVDELRVARRLIVLTTALTAGLLFAGVSLLVPRWQGKIGGILASLVFLAHPRVHTLGRQVMLDMPALAFSLAAILCSWRAVEKSSSSNVRRGIWGVSAGIFSGLALSSKLNAGIVFITVLGVATVALVLDSRRWTRIFYAAVALLPPIIFLSLDPQLWPDIKGGIEAMFELGRSIAGRRYLFPDVALWTVGDRLAAFYSGIFGGVLQLLLFAIAVVSLLRNWATTWPFATWGLLAISAVLWWTPLNWDRYYLPVVPFYALAIGYLFADGAIVVSAKLSPSR